MLESINDILLPSIFILEYDLELLFKIDKTVLTVTAILFSFYFSFTLTFKCASNCNSCVSSCTSKCNDGCTGSCASCTGCLTCNGYCNNCTRCFGCADGMSCSFTCNENFGDNDCSCLTACHGKCQRCASGCNSCNDVYSWCNWFTGDHGSCRAGNGVQCTNYV